MEVLIKKDWNYILKQDAGELKLSVLAGSVGLYEIILVLNGEEKEEYMKRGEVFIDELANQIRSNAGNFKGRIH